MVIEATITRNKTQTTMVRAEGREHDLRATIMQCYTIYTILQTILQFCLFFFINNILNRWWHMVAMHHRH